jgi:predicted TIM-barrel fold metal-dependent hydrolase
VDAGINWEGYASDYGRTWITGVDPAPNARQEEHFRRWRAVVDAALEILKPGVSALQLGRAAIDANDGVRPWIEHCLASFGVDRCMFASNFPVDAMHGTFDELYGGFDRVTADLDAEARDKLFAGNAERLYRC